MWIWSAYAAGATFGVGAEYATIAEAVAAATDGDTIELAAGTYEEAITTNKDLTFRGFPGSLWRCPVEDRCLIATGDLVVEDLAFRGGGILTLGTSTVIRASTFTAAFSNDTSITSEIPGPVTITDSAFDGSGRPVVLLDVQGGGPVVVERSSFHNAYDGVLVVNGVATISASSFTEMNGKAIVSWGDLLVEDVTLADSNGLTQIDLNAGDVTLAGITWENITGSLLANSADSTLTASNLTVTGNNNQGDNPREGCMELSGSGTIEGVTATNNQVTFGGLMVLTGGTWQISDVTASGNLAIADGGVISAQPGATATLTGLELRNNRANRGGGVAVWGADVTIIDSVIADNTARLTGGGVFGVGGATVAIQDSEILGNFAQIGGGLRIIDATMSVTDTLVAGNDGTWGGGLSSERSSTELVRTVFANNVGVDGAAFAGEDSDLVIRNSIVAGNDAGPSGDYVAFLRDAAIVENTAFFDNIGAMTPGESFLNLRYSWIDDFNTVADEIVDVLPTHVFTGGAHGMDGWSNDGDESNDSYLLSPGSVLIDAGDPNLIDPDGTVSDIGLHAGPDADFSFYVDADNDGIVELSDCDESDPTVFPGAVELCNGIDDDCDGEADEELLVLLWIDADGDGFGSNESISVCPGTPGHVGNTEDLDDSDPSVGSSLPEPDTSTEGPTDTTEPEPETVEKPAESKGCQMSSGLTADSFSPWAILRRR